jgi:hypothetical protein
LEDFVHDYYSVQRFKNTYNRLIEPLLDKTQCPKVDIPFPIGAPLDKKGVGRYRKLRIKGCLEGGSGGKTKKNAKEAANEANKDAEMEAVEAANGKRQLIRGKRKCKRCGELGHGETSYKCRLNGTKKPPKRKARPNTTKYGQNAKVHAKGQKSMFLVRLTMNVVRLTMNVVKSYQSQVPPEQGKHYCRIVLIGCDKKVQVSNILLFIHMSNILYY